MTTARGNATLRELGQRVLDALGAGGYSEPYREISPRWFWSLRIEGARIGSLVDQSGLLVVVHPGLDSTLGFDATQSSACSLSVIASLTVVILKPTNTSLAVDVGDDEEIDNLARFSQEVGEVLRELTGVSELEASPFLDYVLMDEERVFGSAWTLKLE